MAHKKGVGSSKNGRESESKRLGVKVFGGQFARRRFFSMSHIAVFLIIGICRLEGAEIPSAG